MDGVAVLSESVAVKRFGTNGTETQRKATARRVRQASPGDFCYRTLSVGESGGKPPHSKMG